MVGKTQQTVQPPQSRPGIKVMPSHMGSHCHGGHLPASCNRRKYQSAIPAMSAPQDPRDWRAWARVAAPYARPFSITMAIIAVPLSLLYLTPLVLGLFAPTLDPRVDLYAVNRPLAFTFLDAAGEDVGHRGAIVGQRLTLKEMPSYLPAAFIAMEDRRFYSHKGIDPLGLARALLLDLRARHYVAGGST